MITGADAIEPADATLILGMPAATYHADPCPEPSLSSGVGKILLSSARKAWLASPRLNPHYVPEHDTKFDAGTIAHALLLEGDESGIVVIDADDWRTKAAKEQRDQARAAGKTPILAHQIGTVRLMVEAARRFIGESEIAEAWTEADSEVTIQWREGDVWCRCRLDRLSYDHRFAGDYKTTEDASPEAFPRTMANLRYAFQAAFYARGVRALGGADPAFVFLAQETEHPFDCALYGCDPGLRVIAEAQVEAAIDRWRECLRTKEWPGYGPRVRWVDAPVWLQREHEEMQALGSR